MPLLDGITFEQAAFLEPVYTAVNGQYLLGYGEGDTVVVVGTGSMGWDTSRSRHTTAAV